MTPKMPPTTIIRMTIAIINSIIEKPRVAALNVFIELSLVSHHHTQADWRRLGYPRRRTALPFRTHRDQIRVRRCALCLANDRDIPANVVTCLKGTGAFAGSPEDISHEVIIGRIRLVEIDSGAVERRATGGRADRPGCPVAIAER